MQISDVEYYTEQEVEKIIQTATTVAEKRKEVDRLYVEANNLLKEIKGESMQVAESIANSRGISIGDRFKTVDEWVNQRRRYRIIYFTIDKGMFSNDPLAVYAQMERIRMSDGKVMPYHGTTVKLESLDSRKWQKE